MRRRLRGTQEKLRAYAAREEEERIRAALRRDRAIEHFRALCAQAGELRAKLPDFDLMAAEFRAREAEEAARKAAEAVSAAVRSGAARPRENGAQSASLGAPGHRSMSREQREALKRRIYAAGAQGDHLPAGH